MKLIEMCDNGPDVSIVVNNVTLADIQRSIALDCKVTSTMPQSP